MKKVIYLIYVKNELRIQILSILNVQLFDIELTLVINKC